jgi:hypothetical protein
LDKFGFGLLEFSWLIIGKIYEKLFEKIKSLEFVGRQYIFFRIEYYENASEIWGRPEDRH